MKNTVKILFFSLSVLFMCLKMPVQAAETRDYCIEDLQNIKITFCEGSKYTFTGKPITPDVEKISFKDENGVYQEKTDGFEIIYTEDSKNKDLGKANVLVAIDGYAGEKKIENVFSIVLGNVTGFKTASVTYNNNGLYWDELEGAHGYQIYRSTASGKKGTLIKTITSGGITSYCDQKVELAKTYYYTIRAYRDFAGKRHYCDNSKQLSLKAKLATAEIVSAKKATYKTINIKWNQVADADGYRIYKCGPQGGTYKTLVTITDGNTLQYTDTEVVCGETYQYKVNAYKIQNKTKYFGNRSAAVAAKATPGTIQFADSTVAASKQVTLCWKRSSGANGYKIYRSTTETSGYKVVKTITNPATLKWTDKNLDENTAYYYKIRPYVTVGTETVYGFYSKIYVKNSVAVKMQEIQAYTYVPYVSGGNTPSGWDCSGFTQWAMNHLFGIKLPRSSAEQADFGTAVNKDDMSQWKAGDILVYAANGRVNHVALYLGNGKIMHALNKNYGTIIQDAQYYESWDKKNNLCAVRRCF